MNTIVGLNASLVKLHQGLLDEMQCTSDAKREITAAFATVSEALNSLNVLITETLDGRIRAVAEIIGTETPAVESAAPRRIA